MPETELYAPVKELLEKSGYTVKAEVGDCDVFAVAENGETLAVELKLHLNLDVIVQAVMRQKIADKVYVAVPSPKKSSLKRRNNISVVLRRLEIGLITVKKDGAKITFPAKAYDRDAAVKRSRSKREKIEEEFIKRHGDRNVGGTKGKTVTLYRERAVLIAALAEKYGKIAFSDIAEMAGDKKARELIKRNYYGWFSSDNEFFALTEKGKDELCEYRELADELIKEAEDL